VTETPVAGLRGPNAVAGLRGPNAVAGLRGPNAVAGLRGPNAVAGLRGPNAVAGLRGPNAVAGLRGPNAVAGLRGPNAVAGLRGRNAVADVVVPTVGRPSLTALLDALRDFPGRVLVVDDRPDRDRDLVVDTHDGVELRRSRGAGPAAARNVGWQAATAPWVVFLDDDVVPDPGWQGWLGADLAAADPDVAGVQGRLRVPLPTGRRPTDWERNVAGLTTARWATADMAYRRDVLAAVGGFDERFPRAFREDADLALRVQAAGWRLVTGERTTTHPVRPAGPWTSVLLQAGNADDALMRALHGPGWNQAAGAPKGRIRRHLATTAAGAVALAGLAARRPRLAGVGAAGWLLGTAELAAARIGPGPRTRREVATMVSTSAVLPLAATWHRLAGEIRARRLVPPRNLARCTPADAGRSRKVREGQRPDRPEAVLLDRDGTLVVDVPYNGRPDRVVPVPGARQALDRLRAAGVRLAVVSNQSGVARGLVTPEEVDAVNRRVEELLGPLGPWLVCPHGPDDACGCRKPAGGLVEAAAAALGVAPERCVVVGDIGADIGAARAAGARGVLVPTPATRPDEVESAPEVAPDLNAAVDLLLGGA
jgi:histidinol-phosphate phosphatase family protein